MNIIIAFAFIAAVLSSESFAFECSDNYLLSEKGSPVFSAFGAVNCSWVILVSDDYIVQLKITKHDVEAVGSSSCLNNYIQVRDGENSSSSLLGRVCNSQPGASSFSSSGTYLWVEYRSTNPNNKFEASFTKTLDQSLCPQDIITNGTSGITYSPFYPLDFKDDMDCSWRIVGPSGSHVIFAFHWICFGICTSIDSSCDMLTVSDAYKNQVLSARSQVTPAVSRQNIISLHFLTDSVYTSVGFKAQYDVVFRDTACSKMIHLTNTSGWFSSPNFPLDYPGGAECGWNISVPSGHKLFLTFLAFAVEECGSGCTCDYVEVRYGQSPYAERKCGSISSRSWTVSGVGSNVLVTFKSDGQGSATGFEAVYTILLIDAYDSVPSAYCPLTYRPTTDSVYVKTDHVDSPRTAITHTALGDSDSTTPDGQLRTTDPPTTHQNSAYKKDASSILSTCALLLIFYSQSIS